MSGESETRVQGELSQLEKQLGRARGAARQRGLRREGAAGGDRRRTDEGGESGARAATSSRPKCARSATRDGAGRRAGSRNRRGGGMRRRVRVSRRAARRTARPRSRPCSSRIPRLRSGTRQAARGGVRLRRGGHRDAAQRADLAGIVLVSPSDGDPIVDWHRTRSRCIRATAGATTPRTSSRSCPALPTSAATSATRRTVLVFSTGDSIPARASRARSSTGSRERSRRAPTSRRTPSATRRSRSPPGPIRRAASCCHSSRRATTWSARSSTPTTIATSIRARRGTPRRSGSATCRRRDVRVRARHDRSATQHGHRDRLADAAHHVRPAAVTAPGYLPHIDAARLPTAPSSR